MRTKPALTSSDCDAIVGAAIGEAARNGWAVSIAILDDGGHMLRYVRMDGAGPATAEVSRLKAHTAAMTRKSTKSYEDRISVGRNSILSMPFTAVQGGLPIFVGEDCVGGIGVSGRESHEDERIAEVGIASLKTT